MSSIDRGGSGIERRCVSTSTDGQRPLSQEQITHLFQYAQIGLSANGIVHDLNNYLGAVMAYAELVSMDAALDDESRRMVSEIVNAVTKSTNLLGTLTMIARKESAHTEMTDMTSLVQRVVDLLAYDMKVAHVAYSVNAGDGAGSAIVDAPRLVRAMMCLITNAIENMLETGRKGIDIDVSGTKDTVEITVKDTGPAIPEEVSASMFDARFTTKGGTHTGMGLTLAREIAARHDGELVYDPGRGFVLRLARGPEDVFMLA